MEIRHAAAWRAGMILVQDIPAKRGASRPDDLRDGAAKVLPAYAIHAPKRAEQPLSAGRDVCRCDANNRTPGHDKDHSEIRNRRHGTPRDLLDGSYGGTGGGGRDPRSRPNPLIHE
jgi:hypothetical protein